VEFVTGSTRNGSLLANTHQFTGSVLVTGSQTVNGIITSNGGIIGNANDNYFGNYPSGDYWDIGNLGTTGTVYLEGRGASTNINSQYRAKGAGVHIWSYNAGSNEIMRTDSSGNVGIGTTAITAKLHVSGTTGGVFEVDGAAAINALYVSASGNVGIGTTSPLASLDVNGNARIAGVIITGNPTIPAGTGAALTEGYYAVGGYAFFQGYNYTTLAYIPVYVDGSTLYLNPNSGGNVGIGTTTVGSKFQVNGNAAIGYSVSTAAPSNGLTVSGSTLIGTTTDSGYKLDVNGTGRFSGALTGTTATFSSSVTATSFNGTTNNIFSVSDTEIMRITSTGLGIGTTSPSSPLMFGKSVYGNTASENFYRIKFEDVGGVNNDTGIGQPASGCLGFNTSVSGYTSFNEGTNNERMRIENGGNVLIGTTTDSGFKLDVNGTGRFSGASTAGFVTSIFAKNPSTNAASAVKIGFDAGGTIWAEIGASYNSNSPYLGFYVRANSEKMRITDGGNLLVNTTTDSGYKLDVSGSTRLNGNTTVTGSIDVSGSITSNGTITAQTLVVQTVTSSIEFVTGSTRNGSLAGNTHQFTGSVSITGSAAALLNVNNGVLYVSASGNVGINNVNPTVALDVTGAGKFSSSVTALKYIANSQATYASLTYEETFKYASSPAGIWFGNSFNSNNNVGLQLRVSNDGTSVQALTITPTGNVGIGTSSPSAISTYTTLDIRGGTGGGLRMGVSGSSTPFNLQQAGTDAYLNNVANGSIIFYTNDTLRAQITSTGVFQPGANGTQDLGTSSLRWGTIYTSDLSLSNGIGDYTIVEGEEKLYLYNNKNNKVYSFVLQEEDPLTATPKKS
jgi:hypothetical protein